MRNYPLSTQQQALLGFLEQAPEDERWWTRRQLEDASGLSTCRVTQSMGSLVRRGLVATRTEYRAVGAVPRTLRLWALKKNEEKL